jgi:lipopolysaccharide/colanic/teichoic acid biosynthesis glycosyltransferase
LTGVAQSPAEVVRLDGWTSVEARPRIWGRRASELHEAWWRTQGVAWVRRGEGDSPPSDAELYLLTEPRQMVLFDLDALTEALTWNRPDLSRIRVVSEGSDSYRERVVTSADGRVVAIRREYSAEVRGGYRVVLTIRRDLAELWSRANDRRTAWLGLRSSGGWSRSDHHRIPGDAFLEGDAAQEGAMLSRLIERWRDPDRVLSGLREISPGVWAEQGSDATGTMIGPAWIGRRSGGSAGGRCVVGPAWVADEHDTSRPAAEMLPIREIGEPRRRSQLAAGDASGGTYDLVKRALDLVASASALILVSPLLAAIAIAVLLDDGWPVVFGHERQSRGGRSFKCWKFRTMKRNAESMVSQLRDHNLCDGPQVNIADDPRVTRLGRLLRRFHLDELLQFWNVLLGQMSLVGPRPSPERENRLCPAWRDARLSVRPGITGLWQVRRTRQPGLDFQEWIRFDMQYVRDRSLGLDLKILLATARQLIVERRSHAPKQESPS